MACGSNVEDFSSTSHLLSSLYIYSCKHTSYSPTTLHFSLFFPLYSLILYAKLKTSNACRLLLPLLSVWWGFFSPLRQHLLFPCEQLLCNIIESSLCLSNLFWFRGSGCIEYLQLIAINLYRHQKICSNQKKQTLKYISFKLICLYISQKDKSTWV